MVTLPVKRDAENMRTCALSILKNAILVRGPALGHFDDWKMATALTQSLSTMAINLIVRSGFLLYV